MTTSKRRIKRISVELPVTVHFYDAKREKRLGEPLSGRIINFSPMGAALNVATIMHQGKHLFYTIQDNPNIVLELTFELGEAPGEIIRVPAAPVWFDRDLEPGEKQFVMGLKFLLDTRCSEIKAISKEACRDEKRLVSLWKKFF
jgi:hypothetical protein